MHDCQFQQLVSRTWTCSTCKWVYKGIKSPYRNCPGPQADITPILSRLAKLTNHPEIIDQPNSYARAAQLWAAGIPGELEPDECRTDSEVKFIQALCRANVCGKHHDGVCKPSCGSGMIIEVKARMASETCPWAWSRW